MGATPKVHSEYREYKTLRDEIQWTDKVQLICTILTYNSMGVSKDFSRTK